MAVSRNVLTVDFKFVRPSVTKRTEKIIKMIADMTKIMRVIKGPLHILFGLALTKAVPDRSGPTRRLPKHLKISNMMHHMKNMTNKKTPAKMRPQR